MSDATGREDTDHRKNTHYYWQHVALDGTVSPRVYVGLPNTAVNAPKQPQAARNLGPGHQVTPHHPKTPHGASERDT